MKINSNDYATFYCNYETIKNFLLEVSPPRQNIYV